MRSHLPQKRNATTEHPMMRRLMSAAILMVLVTCTTMAQDSTMSAKMDTLLYYQKKVLEMEQRIYGEVAQFKEPLAGKRYGIELNPAYLIASLSQSYVVVSAGFSFFDITRKAEIALPIFLQSGKPGDKSNSSRLFLLNQDLLFREFLGRHQDGLFIEAGMRYTHIGEDYRSYTYGYGYPATYRMYTTRRTTDKAGLMFGVGYRYFSYSGLYWGTSIKYGAYFSSDEEHYDGILFEGSRTIIDIELLKFGIAF